MLQHKRTGRWASVVRLLRDDQGATAVEYGLIIGLVGLAVVVCFSVFGDAFQEMLDRLNANMTVSPNTPEKG